MDFTYDDKKNEKNIAERGLSFEDVERFAWDSALIVEDVRRQYSEVRYQALGTIDARLHMLVFTVRDESIRVISLRRANTREVDRYEKVGS